MPGRLIAAIALQLIFGHIDAQVSDFHSPRFHSINNIGLLTGSEKRAIQLQTIGGMGYKNWFAGIGAALDYYRFRTIPLFFDLRHYFGKTRDKYFLYGDAGNAFSLINSKQKKNVNSNAHNEYSGKGYFEMGGGYKLSLGKKNAMMVSLGYSRLNLKETTVPFDPYVFIGYKSYNYNFNRLSIKLGIFL